MDLPTDLTNLSCEYMTLEQKRHFGCPITQAMLREQLPLEYPTLEAMYKSGFEIPPSVLKSKITVDVKPFYERTQDCETLKDQESMAADILLYGVPDELIKKTDLYHCFPQYLRKIIVKTLIDQYDFSSLRSLLIDEVKRDDTSTTIVKRLIKQFGGQRVNLAKSTFHLALEKGIQLIIDVFVNEAYDVTVSDIETALKYNRRDVAIQLARIIAMRGVKAKPKFSRIVSQYNLLTPTDLERSLRGHVRAGTFQPVD